MEIKQDEEQTVYKDLQEIGDDLPDHSPRFVLLSYPLTLVGEPVGVRKAYLGLLLEIEAEANIRFSAAFRTNVGTLRTFVLPSRHMQCGTPDAIRRCEGVDEKHS